MADTISARLDAALAHDADFEFLGDLAAIDARYNGVMFGERPEPLALFGCAYGLYMAASGDGIARYLDQSDGDDLYRAIDEFRRIGASRAADYLEAVTRLFPDGRVPGDRDARGEVTSRLELDAMDAGVDNPLAAIDEEYEDALPALAATLREWVSTNRDAVEAMLGRVPPPATPSATLVELMESGLAAMEGMVADDESTKTERATALRRAATERGMLPWRDTGPDPRFEAFVSAVAHFGADAWATVAERRLARPREVDAAQELATDTNTLLKTSGLVDAKGYDGVRQRFVQHAGLKAIGQAMRALPRQAATRDGRSVGLQWGAAQAFNAALRSLFVHDWMMLTPEGRDAARVAYAVFDGLAPVPMVD